MKAAGSALRSRAGQPCHVAWTARRPCRNGFTLLEILLAISLVGLVLVALNTFIFSMGELWGRNRDLRLFDQHVRAVTRYLHREIRQAALPPSVTGATAAVEAREVRVEFGRTANLITFGLREGSRLFTWPERPLPEVVCSLEVRRDVGLVLYWRSVLEERFESDPPRELLLTPLAVGIAYDYYDPDFRRWETVPQLRQGSEGELETPGRVRLSFQYRNLTRESLIPLPAAGGGLPMF